jgi:NTP pyrophosphatase (non-canonical NTP hydrolase)
VDPATLQPLIDLGLPGIAIIALGLAFWKKSEKVDQMMEVRIQEMRETLEAINNNTQALNALTTLLRDRRGGE